MTDVTVQGAVGTFTFPFSNSVVADAAQNLGNRITDAFQAGLLYQPADNTTPSGPFPGGAQYGAAVISDASSPPSVVTLPRGYAVVLDEASTATTVVGALAQVAPYSVLGGTGGMWFQAGRSMLGGEIYLGGGANTISGNQNLSHRGQNFAGGLKGDWTIGTGGGQSLIVLGSGNDTVHIGGADTVFAGGANVSMDVATGNTQGVTVYLGSGDISFVGGAEAGDSILNPYNATGGGFIQLGTGGNGVAYAGSGNTTLIGGGDGDQLYANRLGSDVLYASGDNTLHGGSGASRTDTFYGFSSISGGGDVLMDASAAKAGQIFWAGAGNDTIKAGSGADSVFFSSLHTGGGDDLITGWNIKKDVLYLDTTGYGGNPAWSNTNQGAVVTLSDGTSITFQGVSDYHSIKVLQGPHS